MDEKEIVSGTESTLEEDFEKLEELLKEMEREDIGIEEAFDCYAKGMELIKQSNSKIDLVEKKVKLLSDNLTTEDFEE
ncbi:MAG: exodeoxyribonuclease VII small subunit [Lachnospiraceae bacterium]|nr:exodeoxyribonuclease VII small subunit [Lachnospiraceae bacterium]